ncbi:MAG: hypothetical protein AAGC81_14905 [Pseudomonadota bacterium]
MEKNPSCDGPLKSIWGKAIRLILLLAWVNVPIVAAFPYDIGNAVALLGGAAVLLAALVTFAGQLFGEAVGRSIALVGLQGQAALIVAAMAGGAWQVDGHMYFFALLAVGVLMIDGRAIIASAAFIAVHHLLLNFVVPGLI